MDAVKVQFPNASQEIRSGGHGSEEVAVDGIGDFWRGNAEWGYHLKCK